MDHSIGLPTIYRSVGVRNADDSLPRGWPSTICPHNRGEGSQQHFPRAPCFHGHDEVRQQAVTGTNLACAKRHHRTRAYHVKWPPSCTLIYPRISPLTRRVRFCIIRVVTSSHARLTFQCTRYSTSGCPRSSTFTRTPHNSSTSATAPGVSAATTAPSPSADALVLAASSGASALVCACSDCMSLLGAACMATRAAPDHATESCCRCAGTIVLSTEACCPPNRVSMLAWTHRNRAEVCKGVCCCHMPSLLAPRIMLSSNLLSHAAR
jgi:hypothetical protein